MRRALVLGCGGPLGFAWTAVALDSLETALGWDVREAQIIQGTSAGAETAVLLGAGTSAADMLADLEAVEAGRRVESALGVRLRNEPRAYPPAPALNFPAVGLTAAAARRRVDLVAGLAGLLPRGRGDAQFLRRLAGDLCGETWPGRPGQVRLVGADVRTGQTVAFGAPGTPTARLADALAASWAIPGWYPPVHVAGRDYVDGGAVSPTSAHMLLGEDLNEVVIVAPMSTEGGAPARGPARAERVLRRAMTRRVDREAAQLRDRGVRVVRIEPGAAELAAMGANFTDVRRRRATLDAAQKHLPSTIQSLLERQS